MALAQRYLIRPSLCLLALVAASVLRAQPPEPPPEFRLVSMSSVETFFFDVGKTKEVLHATIGSFSRLYPAPQNRIVALYREVRSPDPALPPTKVIVAQAILPAQKPGPFLILLDKNPKGPLEFDALVIDDSLEAHPAGTYLVFNFSKRRLAVRLAEQNLMLPRGQSAKVDYPKTRKAWLKVAADENGAGWLLVSSSPHAVGANSRTTIFLVDIPPSPRDPDPKGIVARRIRETIFTDEKGVQHVK